MKVLICGSRTINDYKHLETAVLSSGFIPTLIISGGARGVDRMAEMYASHYGLPTQIFYPDWDRYGESAGMLRNIEMLNHCEAVIALYDGVSKGTLHTITEAKKRGLPLFVEYCTVSDTKEYITPKGV